MKDDLNKKNHVICSRAYILGTEPTKSGVEQTNFVGPDLQRHCSGSERCLLPTSRDRNNTNEQWSFAKVVEFFTKNRSKSTASQLTQTFRLFVRKPKKLCVCWKQRRTKTINKQPKTFVQDPDHFFMLVQNRFSWKSLISKKKIKNLNQSLSVDSLKIQLLSKKVLRKNFFRTQLIFVFPLF